MLCWSFCLAFILLTAPSVTTKSKLCHQIALYTLYYRSELNCQKKGHPSQSVLHNFELFWTPLQAGAWSSLEIVQFITQWVLSLFMASPSHSALKKERRPADQWEERRKILDQSDRSILSTALQSFGHQWGGPAGGNREGRCLVKQVDCASECLSILIHSTSRLVSYLSNKLSDPSPIYV